MKKTNLNPQDLVVDAKDNHKVAALADYCKSNLANDEWEYVVMQLFPLWIRFKFHCEKTKVFAILNT